MGLWGYGVIRGLWGFGVMVCFFDLGGEVFSSGAFLFLGLNHGMEARFASSEAPTELAAPHKAPPQTPWQNLDPRARGTPRDAETLTVFGTFPSTPAPLKQGKICLRLPLSCDASAGAGS